MSEYSFATIDTCVLIYFWHNKHVSQYYSIPVTDMRDRDVQVMVGDDPKDFDNNHLCTKLNGAVRENQQLCCQRPIRGRYVWLQRHTDTIKTKLCMHICEVEVLSCKSNKPNLGPA